ncbi:Glutathione gamma-glutamylcysteinyltransferase 1 [Camellia lanceoleosa]|uniref:Glutathione gamma-glutamylcysteinyltransferase 1 n=1 Tax=Camellia lanceoleosa TaxID=1840588 RepID=A0ACC0FLN6_9ERIC|nr:Glutathione gamma-glutamylcysteinyltransferase 1 [Camellia lanceoleosa]
MSFDCSNVKTEEKRIQHRVFSTQYKRPLHPPAIVFSTKEGEAMFCEAIAGGTAFGSLKLIENFGMQRNLNFCGPAILCTVLNALRVDPERPWKEPKIASYILAFFHVWWCRGSKRSTHVFHFSTGYRQSRNWVFLKSEIVGLEDKERQGTALMESTVGLRKWPVLEVGIPPVGETISSSLSSWMVSSCEDLDTSVMGLQQFHPWKSIYNCVLSLMLLLPKKP